MSKTPAVIEESAPFGPEQYEFLRRKFLRPRDEQPYSKIAEDLLDTFGLAPIAPMPEPVVDFVGEAKRTGVAENAKWEERRERPPHR